MDNEESTRVITQGMCAEGTEEGEVGEKFKKEDDQMEKDKKTNSQPKQPKPKSIDVEVGSVKSLCADYLNQLDASEAIYEGGEEASATKKRSVDMTKDKRTSFGLFDLPSDAPSDDPENDDLTSVTPSEAEGATLQFSPPLEEVQQCQATRDTIARLLKEKRDDDVEKQRRRRERYFRMEQLRAARRAAVVAKREHWANTVKDDEKLSTANVSPAN